MQRMILGRNSAAVLQRSLHAPIFTRALGLRATGTEGVIDKEADFEQIEQLNRQMEATIFKEKHVMDLNRAKLAPVATWETSSVGVMHEATYSFSSDNVPNQFEREQSKLLEQELSSIPDRGPGNHPEQGARGEFQGDNEHPRAAGLAEIVMEKMRSTKEALKETFPGVHDMGHNLKETAKKSMSQMKNRASNSMDSEQSKKSEEPKEKNEEQSKQQDSEKNKPRCKQFSEHRENASLL